ncbi:MAG: DUF882 domain-containing protein [Arcobacteraceae bacterium]|jgi:uncharacterized protein YcbK (DUF882 family)|nr:DUF882 domain-containing protein [Arcobacteraceae bacterium]
MNRENKHLQSVNSRRDFLKVSSIFLASGLLTHAEAKKIDIEKLFAFKNDSKKLHLYSLNSRKTVDIEYYANGKYSKDGLNEIYKLLADRRTGEVAKIDNHIIESLYDIQTTLNTSKPITILSGYRSIATNNQMAQHSDGVSTNSYHTKGKAVDLFVQGISISELHTVVNDIHAGGIGYYPSSGFVHMDAGPIRTWVG